MHPKGAGFDVEEQRKAWEDELPQIEAKKIVFLDESGSNINMTRLYGRAQGKNRVVDNAPFSKPQNITILSSIRLDGTTKYVVYQGGTTGDRFLTYLKESLIPTLHEGDIVVMDNLRTHHIAEVRQIIEGAKCQLMYLPPYSPDYNPIEMMWSKVKSVLRKLKARTIESLKEAIIEAMSMVTPDDCLGWFKKSGISC